ncbi:MAG: type II secretion system protein [Candidatus Omnitrophica bacterium]|nr:type II secretion system protein [Candidatus Omnitrophota bacterium]
MTHYSLQKIHSKRGQILLFSLVVMVFLSTLLGAAMLRSDVQVKEIINRKRLQEAFYAAETGIDTAIYNLRQNSAWKPGQNGVAAIVDQPFNITVAGSTTTIGYYSITVIDAAQFNGWDSRWITAQGKDREGIITRTIKARVIVESPTRFLISTLGPLHMTSGSQLNADILAKDVYFDVNASLPSPQNEINVNGNVLYINSKTGETNPAVIFGSGKTITKSPSITFAGVDLNRYEQLSQDLQTQNLGYHSTGDLTVNLDNLSAFNQNPGSSFEPKIIYAKGNIYLSGEYDNSVLIVAGGNVYVNGSIIANSSVQPVPQLGIFAKGDVIIPESTMATGDLNIEGFILADGGTPGSKGAFLAEGAKYSKATLNFKGSISVRGTGTNAVDLNVFKNRNYDFNSALSNNRTIPFIPFIVNTVLWQEI